MRSMAFLIGLASLLAALSASCGGDGPCPSLCKEVKPKLVDQVPGVTPDDVHCSSAPWTKALTCDVCIQILEDRYDVSVTDEGELCSRHF